MFTASAGCVNNQMFTNMLQIYKVILSGQRVENAALSMLGGMGFMTLLQYMLRP